MAISLKYTFRFWPFRSLILNIDNLYDDLYALLYRREHEALGHANVGNGGTAGRLRTNSSVTYRIGGTLYVKASTDDLWNLSAETDTTGAQYRAYWLYLDSSGTAAVGAGTNAASAAAAIAALPTVASTKAVIGVFVAGLSTDFDAVGGLAAQGTIYNGWPTAQTLTAESVALT